MMPGMDPKKMQALMKQMGIKSEEIPASRVVIETAGGAIIVDEPQVVKITMQGQSSFQVSGSIRKEEKSSPEDVKMVMEQAGCTEAEAAEALEKSGGDIAQAILSLTESKE